MVSGTIYLMARYYKSDLGRFTQQDGWEFVNPEDPLSLNLYTYCWNDPIQYIDPFGHYNKDGNNSICFGADGMGSGLGDAQVGGLLIVGVSVLYAGIEVLDALWQQTEELIAEITTGIEEFFSADAKAKAEVDVETSTKEESKSKNESNDEGYYVYHLIDPITNEPQYVGRTKNPEQRADQHRKNEYRKDLYMEIIYFNIPYKDARALEQYEMIRCHTLNRSDKKHNQINGLNIKRDDAFEYIKAAARYLTNYATNELYCLMEN